MRYGIVIIFISIIFGCQSADTLFKSLDTEHTGIEFTNTIQESDSFNILETQYLYNGGGVGVGDFNNDGLDDLYFTGNHVDNRLYLNEGDLRFKDVTTVSNTAGSQYWGSGPCIVDINLDGRLDIYINNTTYPDSANRVNLLYINQGNNDDGVPQFEEQAAEYGLDEDGYTVNSAFFDYDNDGDLDVFMIVNEQGDVRGSVAYQNSTQRKKVYQRIDKLFKNDFDASKGHAVFTEVTHEAGITEPGFSLGLNITDINKDGWKDIYISNDFISEDVIYINQGNGTFINKAREYLKHTSHSAMGNDVADINNDGYNDIIALDMMPEDNYRQKRMLGPNNYSVYINNERYDVGYQYARNSLQLNPGNDDDLSVKYSEISLMAGMSATDWSWTPLVVDFDQDGYRDIIVTNGFPKDVTDKDFMDYRADVARYASKEMMIAKIPSVEIHNYAYRNNGNLQFEDVSASWGLTEKTFSNGAIYSDLDNDGDLDVVVNNIDGPASVLRNDISNAKTHRNWIGFSFKGDANNPDAIGATVNLLVGDQQITYEHSIYRGYLSSQSRRAHFGLGDAKIDQVEVIWPDGKRCTYIDLLPNQYHELSHSSCSEVIEPTSKSFKKLFTEIKSISERHQESDYIDFNVQPLLPYKLSQFGPAMSVGDIDNDGLEDVYVSGPAFEHGYFLKQDINGLLVRDTLRTTDANKEEMGSILFDADGDADLDMYIVCGSYEFNEGDSILQDQFLINESGKFVDASDRLPGFFSSGSCSRAADYDRDGDLDIFIGGRLKSGEYPSKVSSYLLKNNFKGSGDAFVLDQSELLEDLGMVTDAIWSDYNNDGWIDLIVAREFAPVLILENQKGVFVKKEILKDKKGFWCSLSAGDIDNDGDIDYVLGNRGQNTFHQISEKYPYQIFVNDFDKNNNTDAVPMAYYKGKDGSIDQFPVASRMDMAKEINVTRKKYATFELYAQVNKKVLFKDSTLAVTDIYEANYASTSVLINNGDGSFDMKPLNTEAQVAPVFGSIIQDIDGDGKMDIVLVGNDYGNELTFGRMDALNGLVLKGLGDTNFRSLKTKESGFYVPGDGKSLVQFHLGSQRAFMAAENMGRIRAFELNYQNVSESLRANEYRVIIELSNGQKITKEIGYGTSFLSQSSRSVDVPKNATRITFIAYDGSQREKIINE